MGADALQTGSGRVMVTNLRHWWQRNFGYVYLTEDTDAGSWYRFKAKKGKVAFVWNTLRGAIPFVCGLSADGKVINCHDKKMSGYGKQYGKWCWTYLDGIDNLDIPKGGYWK